MKLEILLPYKVFIKKEGVRCVVAETISGSLGILPHRLDCVVVLKAGIFTFKADLEEENYVAIDEGILVKRGLQVSLSVRNAVAGSELGQLRDTVNHEYRMLDEDEKKTRTVIAKLENGFMRRLAELRHG